MASEESSSTSHLQVRFVTKQQKYAIPDNPYSLETNIGVIDLNKLVNAILKQGKSAHEDITFSFLINGNFLHITLAEYIKENDIATESLVEIEYLESTPAPKPSGSLLHDDWVSAVRTYDNYILSGCYDNTLKIWTTDGQLLTTVPGHLGPVKSVAWVAKDSESSYLLSGSHDETVLFWEWQPDNKSVKCVHVCHGHAGSVDAIAVNKDHTTFCTGSWDKMLKLWSAEPRSDEEGTDDTGEKVKKKPKVEGAKIPSRVPILTLSGHTEGISSVVWTGQKEVSTASWDHSIRLWDLGQAVQTSIIPGSKAIFDMDYSDAHKTLITASADRHIRMFDPRVTDGAVVKCIYTSHTAWVSCLRWSPDQEYHFVSGSYDNLLKLWDIRSPKVPIFDMAGHDDKILCVDWSRHHQLISGAADNCLKIFQFNPS